MQSEIRELLVKLTNFNQQNGLAPKNLDKIVVFKLLCVLDKNFKLKFESCVVERVHCKLISKNKGFFSNVFQLIVEFENGQKHECVLKLPLIDALGMENRQSIINSHNIEIEFYENFQHFSLLPQIFVARKFSSNVNDFAFILMESFVGKAEPLDLYGDVKDGQVLSAAYALAHLQFCARQKRDWWIKKDRTIYLDELYTNLIPNFFPIMMKKPNFIPLIEQLKPLMNQKFGFYALLDLPRKYDAITICNGDFQSHNLLFKVDGQGKMSNELMATIDWQLVFCGNSLFDLSKFIALSCDCECRERIKLPAFNVYYQELKYLYGTIDLKVPFTQEQGLELYDLIFCHTATVLIEFVGYIEEKYENCPDWKPRIETLTKRAFHLGQSVLPLIEKYGLKRFEQE